MNYLITISILLFSIGVLFLFLLIKILNRFSNLLNFTTKIEKASSTRILAKLDRESLKIYKIKSPLTIIDITQHSKYEEYGFLNGYTLTILDAEKNKHLIHGCLSSHKHQYLMHSAFNHLLMKTLSEKSHFLEEKDIIIDIDKN